MHDSIDVLKRLGFLKPGMVLFAHRSSSKAKRYRSRFNILLNDKMLDTMIGKMEELKKLLLVMGMKHYYLNFFRCTESNLNIFGEINYTNTKSHLIFMQTLNNINSYDCLAYFFFFFCYDSKYHNKK